MTSLYGAISPGGEGPGTPESLPSPAPPSGASEAERKIMEDNMVAVKNLTIRASKYVPSNVSWDGKSETFDTFFAMVSEYVEIELGETAVQVLLGKRTMLDGLPIPKYMYATWSQRLYMVLMGRINLGKDPESATSASAKAVMNHDRQSRGHQAFRLQPTLLLAFAGAGGHGAGLRSGRLQDQGAPCGNRGHAGGGGP